MWLIVLFLVPFYVVLVRRVRDVRPIFRHPVPIWNPWYWTPGTFGDVLGQIFGIGRVPPAGVRPDVVYVAGRRLICLVIGYPRRLLRGAVRGAGAGCCSSLLIAPFWISYLMRMFAWVNLLQATDG